MTAAIILIRRVELAHKAKWDGFVRLLRQRRRGGIVMLMHFYQVGQCGVIRRRLHLAQNLHIFNRLSTEYEKTLAPEPGITERNRSMKYRAFAGANGWYVATENDEGFHHQPPDNGSMTEDQAQRAARVANKCADPADEDFEQHPEAYD